MDILIPVLSLISGKGLVDAVLVLIVVGLVCWLLWWLIGYIALPEPFAKIARVLVAVVAVVFLINFLFGLIGKPFIDF